MSDPLPFHSPDEPGPSLTGATGRRHRRNPNPDPERSRRGRSSRRLGVDQERRAEKRYGWTKIGERGEITDLRGRLMKVQQKSTRRAAPVGWAGIFRQLDAVNDGRTAAILLSFVRQGTPVEDFIVIRGSDWLALHGRDEPA